MALYSKIHKIFTRKNLQFFCMMTITNYTAGEIITWWSKVSTQCDFQIKTQTRHTRGKNRSSSVAFLSILAAHTLFLDQLYSCCCTLELQPCLCTLVLQHLAPAWPPLSTQNHKPIFCKDIATTTTVEVPPVLKNH